jgi:hypothetical protein
MRNIVDQVNQNHDRPVDDVLECMHAIMHLYRSTQHRSLRDGPNDLAHMEVKALGFFARHPGATQSELVAHSGRDKAQVARQIRACASAACWTRKPTRPTAAARACACRSRAVPCTRPCTATMAG